MKLHPTQPALALLCTAEHICSRSPFLSEKTSQRNLPYPIRSQTPLVETGLCLPKMQPHRLGIVWYRVDMRDNFWSQIGSTAVVCQNKQLAERGISEESCQPRTLAISLQPIVFGNSPRLPKVEFVCAECLCSSSWALSLGCVLSTSNAITFFYQSSQFSIYFSRYSSSGSLLTVFFRFSAPSLKQNAWLFSL